VIHTHMYCVFQSHFTELEHESTHDRIKLMAYIPYIQEEEAIPELREMYDRYRDPAGHVDNILRVHGHNPPSLEAHFQLYRTLMQGRSYLSRTQRGMIALVVSTINECHY